MGLPFVVLSVHCAICKWSAIYIPNIHEICRDVTCQNIGMRVGVRTRGWGIKKESRWRGEQTILVSALCQHVEISGASHCLSAAVHAKFAVNLAGVEFDRTDREDQFLGDLLVGQSVSNKL